MRNPYSRKIRKSEKISGLQKGISFEPNFVTEYPVFHYFLEAYSELCKTPKMECFPKIANR